MKSYLIASLALGLLALPGQAQDKPDLKNPKQRTSYALGADIGGKVGGSLKEGKIDFDAKALVAGLADALAGELSLTQAEIEETLKAFQKEMMERPLKEGEAFLATNGKKEGVTVLPSGLQYKVVKAGKGRSSKATDTVKVHYQGTLIDGTVFDSSLGKEPVSFAANRVIRGWTEALQLMKEGDKWQLFIPAKLAYGDEPPGPTIPPNSVLIFEVELLSIEKSGP